MRRAGRLQHLFRQHCRFQLFRFCKREHPIFHCDRRHWQGGPLDAGENSLFSLSDPDDAFAPCLGWGPGVSGCSLKSVIAAASLLKWADGCNMSIQPVSDIKDAYTQWFDSLSADDQQSFADAWPLIKADAETLLTDKDSMTGRIEDAGLDAKELPGCSEENWKALADVIDVLVPASSEY